MNSEGLSQKRLWPVLKIGENVGKSALQSEITLKEMQYIFTNKLIPFVLCHHSGDFLITVVYEYEQFINDLLRKNCKQAKFTDIFQTPLIFLLKEHLFHQQKILIFLKTLGVTIKYFPKYLTVIN